MKETWKAVIHPPFNECYEVSDFDRVRSLDRTITDSLNRPMHLKGQILKPRTNGKEKLLFVELCYLLESGKRLRKTCYVHKLVGECFVPNPKNKEYVTHKTPNKQRNTPDNLKWISHSELQIRNMQEYPKNRYRLGNYQKSRQLNTQKA